MGTNTLMGRNIVFPIHNADGSLFHNLVLHKFTVDSVVMSLGDKITGDVYYKDNTLAVTMSEYVEYNGVHYVLVNPPTIVREGMVSDNSEMKGMTKYNFVFYHPMYMLGNFPFNDVAVSADEQQYLSESRTFSWIGTGNDMIAKLNKNLAGTTWVVVKSDDAMSNAKLAVLSDVLSFDGQFISGALKTAYDTWEVPFVIDKLEEGQYFDDNNVDYYSQAGGSKRFVIVFGRPSNEIYEKDENGDVVLDENEEPVPFVFRMGQGVGLKNNSRTPKNNKIITRIAGYGSENNIPYGYPQIPWTGTGAEADWDYTINNTSGMQTITVGGRTIQAMSYPIYDGIAGGQRVRLIKHPFTRTHLMPTVFAETVDKKVNPKNPNYDPDTIIKDYYDATSPTYVNPIVLDAPCYEVHQFEKIKPQLGEKKIVGVLPYEEEDANSMTVAQFTLYINELISQYGGITARYLTEMLEAFNVTPHVDTNRSYVGGSYTYEWQLKFSGNYCTAFYGSPVLEFQKTVKMSNQAITWDDTMDDDGNYKQSYFKLTLPVLGFDLYACAAITEKMNIVMRGGACIGCTFPVQVDWDDYKKNFYDAEGNFDPVIGTGHPRNATKYPDSTSASITVIVQKDNTTFGKLMPNIYQQPHGESSIGANDGDKFVITGISMPTSYITAAQTELDEAMMEYMLENNVYYYEYPLKFDEYFFATNTQILEQIRTNTIFRFLFGGDVVPKALYAKQITVKYGDNPLPTYDITLTDDIEIVLNQIGQVTDDVSKMRVQLSDLMAFYGVGGGGTGVDYNTLAQALADKLSKVSDDVSQGKITFQKGLETLGRAIFGGELTSNGFVSGMDSTGRGWRIDQQGNAEMESLRVRSYLEVIELLINRLQAQEGDTLFTDNDQITYVEEKTYNGNVYYKLTLKEKWDGYVTAQKVDNILKGIVNTLAANAGNVSDVTESQCVETDGDNKYYTSWMKVVDPSLYGDTVGTNQICVVLFGDASTPASKNFAPCELMNIARFGCTANPNASGLTPAQKADIERRQRLFTISTTDGRITKLRGVNSPILNEGNYGTTLGIIPNFINNWTIADRLIAGRDYLYAQGVIVGDFIKVDVNGEPIVNFVDCGEWVDGSQVETPTVGEGIYLVNEYNETSLQWETHDVWHNNAKWRCLMHQPHNGVYFEPNETNVTYWEKLMEGTEGGDGKSHATVTIFKRIAGTPSSSDKPTATLYYKFSDGNLYTKSGSTYTPATTALNGWSQQIPIYTENPCYSRQVSAISEDEYFQIEPSLWSSDARKVFSDGVNAFVVDLDPDMVSVALQDGDLVNDVDFYFYPKAYYGSTPVINDCTISASTTDPDIALTVDNTNHNVRVHIISGTGLGDATEISVTITHVNYGTRTVTFTIAGVNNGANGEPAVLRELDPSRNVVSFARQADGTLTPSWRQITLQIKKTVGDVCSSETISTSGLTVMYSFVSMPASSSDGTAWGTSDRTTGTSWSSDTLTILSGISATNLYVAAFNSNGVLVDREIIPIVKDGDNGDDGMDSAIAFATPSSISVPCNNGGSVTAQVYKDIVFSMKVGNQSATVSGVTTSGTLPTGVSVTSLATTARRITVSTSATATGISGGVTFEVSGSYDGNTYSAYVTVALIGAKAGAGERGKTGRFYYYGGVWNSSDRSQTFTANDAQAPYFMVGSSYYVYVGTNNFTNWTMYDINRTYGAPSSGNSNFAIMTNDFDYLITKAIFGDYAQFGANIINGDYRFSQYGYMRGFGEKNVQITDGSQYQNISSTDPFGEADIVDSSNDSRKKANIGFNTFASVITTGYYSVIGNNIEFSSSTSTTHGHNVWESGYTYYRRKYETGSNWLDYSTNNGWKSMSGVYWARSNNAAVSSSASASFSWQSTVPTLTDSQPYLWMKTSSSASIAYRVSSKIPTFEITAGKYYTIEIDLKADESYSDLYIGVGSVYNESPSYIMSGSDLKIVEIDDERVAVYATFYCGTSGQYINLFIKSQRDVTFAALYECQFVPYLVEDLKQGRIVAKNIEAKGELHAESLSYQVKNGNGLVVSDESIITLGYNNLNAQITLPTPSEAKGRVIEIYSGINQFDGNNNPISPVFKLGYTGATYNTYFRALTLGNSYYRQANFQNWPESYLKLWSDGTDWYVVRAEQTVYDSTNHQFMIKLLTKTIPNGL